MAAFMSLALIALPISGLSVAVASLSLGWNIYRDVLAKPRVNVRMGIRLVVEYSESADSYVAWVRCVNIGPGKVTLELIVVRKRILAGWGNGYGRFGIIKFVASAITGGSTLPLTLDVGECADLLLPLNRDTFWGSNYSMLGIRDFHGCIHWAPSRDTRGARRQWNDLIAQVASI
jgi:hypothetical protein